ncbi:MAG: hypothetical protein WKG32_05030 [Gemmatimonadaceae bacterium]
MISTRDVSGMPDIRSLRRLTRVLAMLDAILSPEWEGRYYSFDAHWARGELMASMRNGQGDGWFALFTAGGVVLHGLDHEAAMYRPDDPWPGIFDALPLELAGFIGEPAFDTRDSTFCIWRGVADASWQHGPVRFPAGDDPDGSAGLLGILDGRPESYRAWAADYYGVPVPLAAVAAVYRHEPLTPGLVRQLNADVSLDELRDDIAEIGFPEGGVAEGGS